MKLILNRVGLLAIAFSSLQFDAQAQTQNPNSSAGALPAPNPALAAPPRFDPESADKEANTKAKAAKSPTANADAVPASAPGLSLGKPDAKKNEVRERREGGKVTEVEVSAGGSNYRLQANPNVGNAPEGTVQGTSNRPALWSIFQFGGPKKESKEEKETEPVLQPAPARPKEGPVEAAPASTPAPTPAPSHK